MGRIKILKTCFLYADKEIFLIPFQYLYLKKSITCKSRMRRYCDGNNGVIVTATMFQINIQENHGNFNIFRSKSKLIVKQ